MAVAALDDHLMRPRMPSDAEYPRMSVEPTAARATYRRERVTRDINAECQGRT